jgi:hypothetical protein
VIEHGNRCRRVLDEHRQLRFSLCKVRFSPLAFADIDSMLTAPVNRPVSSNSGVG